MASWRRKDGRVVVVEKLKPSSLIETDELKSLFDSFLAAYAVLKELSKTNTCHGMWNTLIELKISIYNPT